MFFAHLLQNFDSHVRECQIIGHFQAEIKVISLLVWIVAV